MFGTLVALTTFTTAVAQGDYYAEPSHSGYQSGYGAQASAHYYPPQEQHYGNQYYAPQQQPAGYGQASAGYGHPYYGTPAPAYKPTEPAYDPKGEWDQFWQNTDLCRAEFGLNQCLLNCHNLKDFFNGNRVSNCVVQFVQGLCGSISTEQSRGYEYGYKNDRVYITTDNCQTSAYADALLVLDRMAKNFNMDILGSLKRQSWAFAAVRLALDVAVERADCTMEAFFYYVTQCSKNNYLEPEDIQCVEENVLNNRCFDGDESQSLDFAVLKDYVSRGETEKAKYYLKEHYGEGDVLEALEEVLQDYIDSSPTAYGMTADYNHYKVQAAVDVCPVNYLWMNHGIHYGYDIHGLPEDCVAFHFPADEYEKYEYVYEKKEYAYEGQKYLENTEPTTGPHDKPEESKEEDTKPDALRDPFTPKSGNIHKTCKDHYEFSKALYILADHDIGSVCYTIDKYTIKFLESGNEERLDYSRYEEPESEEKIPESEEKIPEPEVKDEEPTVLLAEHEGEHGEPYPPAACYRASWRAQKSCVSHLSEWRMHVRCCKSYAEVKKEKEPKVYYTQPPLYAPPSDYYHHQNNYYQQSYQQPYHEPTSAHYLAEEDPYYPAPAPAPAHYAPAPYAPPVYNAQVQYDTYDASAYEFVKVVESSTEQGTLVEKPKDDITVTNGNQGLMDAYYDWATALLDAQEKAEGVTENAEEYHAILKRLYYHKTNPEHSYSRKFDLPEVHHYKGYYIGNDEYSKHTCERLKIDIDFSKVIPLVTGKCYPQSCVMSQYATCIESPAEDYKKFKGAYKAAPAYYHQQPANYYGQPSYRALLSVQQSSVVSLASIGFVAGVAVVALIQYVSSARNNRALL